MPHYVAIDPPRVREFGRALRLASSELNDCATEAARALWRAELDEGMTRHLAELAADLAAVGDVLDQRASAADAIALALALVRSLADLRRTVAHIAPLPICRLGPQTSMGSSSRCNAVTKVELYTAKAGAEIPLPPYSLQLQRDHSYLVEWLSNGRVRVTRIDATRASVGVSNGHLYSARVDDRQVGVEANGAVFAGLVARAGDSYELDPSELDDFIVDDVLEQAATLGGGLASILRPAPVVKATLRMVLAGFEKLPKAGDVARAARRALAWKRPAPVSTFIEGGGVARAGVGVQAVISQLGVGVGLEGVLGVRDAGDELALYLRVSASLAAAATAAAFGREFESDDEIAIAVVRNRNGSLSRIEIGHVTTTADSAVETIGTIDLTRGVPGIDAREVERILLDPRRARELIDRLIRDGRLEVERREFTLGPERIVEIEAPAVSLSFEARSFEWRR